MESFLESYAKKTTRFQYERGIKLFLEFYGKSIDEILAERKDDLTPRPNETMVEAKQRSNRYEKLLEKFYAWMSEQGYKRNSMYTNCKGLRQLFRYYNMGLTLRLGSPITQVAISTDDFVLKPEHVKKMFHCAKDLRSKLLISMGNDLGWRIGDVLSIRRDELPDLSEEPPIEWLRMTEKEEQVSKTCLSKATVTLLKEYLFTFPQSHNPYLFFDNGGTINAEMVNRRLRDLAKEAQIDLGNKSLHWHCFRKMLISVAKNLGVDPDIIKVMVGKSVRKDMLTYMTGIDVKTAFSKLQTVLGITTLMESAEDITKTMRDQIEKLSDALKQVETENHTFKFRIDQLQDTDEKLKGRIDEYGELLAGWVEMSRFTEEEKAAMRKKWNIREWTEEERELVRGFVALANELKNKKGEVNDEEFNRRFKAFLKRKEEDRKQ
jgi:hypothetical protein